MSDLPESSPAKCPIPGAHQLHEGMKLRPILSDFLIFGALDFLYYAAPDFLRNRYLRLGLKSSCVAAEFWYLYHSKLIDPEKGINLGKQALAAVSGTRPVDRSTPASKLETVCAEDWQTAPDGPPFGSVQNGLANRPLGAVGPEETDNLKTADHSDDQTDSASTATDLPDMQQQQSDHRCCPLAKGLKLPGWERIKAKLPFSDQQLKQGTYVVGLAGLSLICSVGIPVAVSRGLYRHAEKKRAHGDRFAHSKQALVLGALNGAYYGSLRHLSFKKEDL